MQTDFVARADYTSKRGICSFCHGSSELKATANGGPAHQTSKVTTNMGSFGRGASQLKAAAKTFAPFATALRNTEILSAAAVQTSKLQRGRRGIGTICHHLSTVKAAANRSILLPRPFTTQTRFSIRSLLWPRRLTAQGRSHAFAPFATAVRTAVCAFVCVCVCARAVLAAAVTRSAVRSLQLLRTIRPSCCAGTDRMAAAKHCPVSPRQFRTESRSETFAPAAQKKNIPRPSRSTAPPKPRAPVIDPGRPAPSIVRAAIVDVRRRLPVPPPPPLPHTRAQRQAQAGLATETDL